MKKLGFMNLRCNMNPLLKVLSTCSFILLLTGCGNFIRYIKTKKAVSSGFVRQRNFVTAIPFKKEIGDKYIVEVTINASPKKYRFILDTGALMVLSQQAAEELGIIEKGKYKNINSLNKHVRLDSVQLAGLTFYRPGTAILDLRGDSFLQCIGVDGVIGSAIMRHHCWQFDNQRQRITVSDRYESLVSDTAKLVLPITVDGLHRPVTPLEFPNGTRKKFIVDIGSNSDFMTKDKALFAKLKKQSKYYTQFGWNGHGFYGDRFDTSYNATIKGIKLTGTPMDSARVAFGTFRDDLVGWGFLNRYVITFNWDQRTLTLVANQPAQSDEPLVSFGFMPFIQKDTSSQKSYWTVGSIIEGSPAHQAGLKLGERIVSVNGNEVSAVTNACDLYSPTSRIYQEMNEKTLRMELVGKSGKRQVFT
ncbi:aspartyl protease family protein [Fibrisoma montanum]|nr:aspartyl protease family protein [Fibrisoma montanum]